MSRIENVARCPEIDPVFVNWSGSSLGDPRLTQTGLPRRACGELSSRDSWRREIAENRGLGGGDEWIRTSSTSNDTS